MGRSPCGPGQAAAAGGGGCGCCSSEGWGPGDQTCAALETLLALHDLRQHREDQTTTTTEQRCQFFVSLQMYSVMTRGTRTDSYIKVTQ